MRYLFADRRGVHVRVSAECRMIGRLRRLGLLAALLTVPQAMPLLHAQSDEDFESYKIRISAFLVLLEPLWKHPGAATTQILSTSKRIWGSTAIQPLQEKWTGSLPTRITSTL